MRLFSNSIFAVLSLFTFTSACSHCPCSKQANYPTHWWAPVSKEGAPTWEILPQEAGPGEVILSKRNELGTLSNFAHTPFEFRGQHYESIEGLWQMMLYPEDEVDHQLNDQPDPRKQSKNIKWDFTRKQVSQMVAFEAKKAGSLAEKNMAALGIDWVSFEGKRFPYRDLANGKNGEQYKIIRAAMEAKLNQNPKVKEALRATGDLILKPDHHQEPNTPPSWRYFEIWMGLRKTL